MLQDGGFVMQMLRWSPKVGKSGSRNVGKTERNQD
jgi:hypothetical protein